MTSLNSFLSKYQVFGNDAEYNFTRFSKPFGKFYIPDDKLDAFHIEYAKHINLGLTTPNLTEKNSPYSPVLIDIDLKYSPDSPLEKHYDLDTAKTITKCYIEFLKEYIDISDLRIYLQERLAPYKDEKDIIKDGFHLFMPNVKCAALLKEKAREHVLVNCKDVLIALGSINPIDDIVDKAVISRNGWFVYGSSKPNASPYLVTHAWDHDLNDLPFDLPFIDTVKMFSIRSAVETVKWVEGGQDKLAISVESSPARRRVAIAAESTKSPLSDSSHGSEKVPFEKLERVVMGLKDFHAIREQDWIDVVWAILHTALTNDYIRRGRNLIHDFSKKSLENYDEKSVENRIDDIKTRTNGKSKTFYSLKKLLQKDNPELHQELFGPTRDYQCVKKEFESTHFKTLEPSGFYRESDNGLIPKRKSELKDDFENLFYIDQLQDNTIKRPFLRRWFCDETIRTFRTIDFLPPPCICPEDTYNLFSGLRAASLPSVSDVDLSLVFDLLSKLCGNDKDVIEYMLDWLAQLVKKPGQLSRTGILLQSMEGVGKNLFLNWIGESILGKQYFFTTTNISDLFGDFAIGLKHKLLVNMNEATSYDTYKFVERIKSAITDETVNYQAKHVNTIVLRNFARFVFSTNQSRAIKCGASDRRWIAIECDNSRCNDSTYFNPVKDCMNDKSAKAFYEYLMKRDVSEWDSSKRPFTSLYEDLKVSSIPILSRWLNHLIENNETVVNESTVSLLNEYKKWCRDNGFDGAASTSNVTNFGLDLKKFLGVSVRKSNGTKYNIDLRVLRDDIRSRGHLINPGSIFISD